MERIARQLRQRVPVIQIELIQNVDQDLILKVLKEIEPQNAYYCKMFLEKLVLFLEEKGEEVNDDLYEHLSDLLQAVPLDATDTEVISYCVSCKSGNRDMDLKVREAPNVISGLGTTGLRTWEASLYLTQYLLNSDHCDLTDATVLELGCGTGLVGMALYKYHPTVKKICITDGDSQLIENLPSNLQLNEIPIGSPKISISKLSWGEDELPDPNIDTIVAADVTYDSSILDDLVSVIYESMTQNNRGSTLVRNAYIAATVRNETTLEELEKLLNLGVQDRIWKWTIMEPMRFDGIWYPQSTPEIRIYRIFKV
ncbi:hypothetical protein KL930_002725 [Ogataea haglerorum]|nr:hypothetical protein KL915_002088 [Ogataea haglerorum]KAG7707497.1 hypothetical protein KL914_002318 [Ogataea haglerorum]KAG7709533.1 hypothetical protein KL950_001752 [Ogataea haglerorum]KAG7738808.1 hypothetical protein KL932_003701 [Ogataea haglerorum]KAG7739463.1 hypothetical protein KL923_002310 [Ogataea haglerorum]